MPDGAPILVRVKERHRGRCGEPASYCSGARLLDRLVRDHAAVAHRDHAVRIRRDVGLVSDHDDGDALLAVERDERLHDLVRVAGVEIARGLVGQEEPRRVDQGPRDCHALLLSAGELAGRVVFALRETEQGQRFARPGRAASAARRPRLRVEERKRHVLDRARARQQVEALEHEAEPLAADARELRRFESRDVDAVQQVPAARRAVEAAEDRHEGGLSRSRRADDGDELTRLHREAHATQGLHVDVAGVVRPRDVGDLDYRG